MKTDNINAIARGSVPGTAGWETPGAQGIAIHRRVITTSGICIHQRRKIILISSKIQTIRCEESVN
jgi:hypothetical protein